MNHGHEVQAPRAVDIPAADMQQMGSRTDRCHHARIKQCLQSLVRGSVDGWEECTVSLSGVDVPEILTLHQMHGSGNDGGIGHQFHHRREGRTPSTIDPLNANMEEMRSCAGGCADPRGE